MKRFLPFVLFLIGGILIGQAQSLKISQRIIGTDTITDEGVTFPASSDDAEQENDEIDTLWDDDIDTGWEGEPDDLNILTAGLRFQNIWIPQGATIDSAYIILYSHEAKTADDVAKISIFADASDNAPTFTEDSLIDARAKTTASLLWEVNEAWGLWTPHRTPDLSAIVQEIVNRTGWASGNAIAFLLLGEDQGPSEVENAREFESFENIADPEDGGDGQNHPERVPELVIYYSVESAMMERTIVATDTITDEGVTFPASSDDAEQENDEIDTLWDDDIDAGWEGEPDDLNILTAGLRFQNLAIPAGAKIDSAFIEVFSHEAKTADDVARITIVADASDNAPTFTEDSLIDARAKTNASLLWEINEEWGLWTPHRTPDLSDIVQEIVDRDGWESGNAIAFLILGEDQGPSEVENAREWESYENIADPEDGGDGQNHPERVPKLIVYYSSPNIASGIFNQPLSIVKSLKVYPNPASKSAIIELESNAPAMIQVFSLTGTLLMEKDNIRQREVQLDVQHLVPGVYSIRAIQNGSLYAQKLIIH